MRTNTLLAILLAIFLLAVPVALATGDHGGSRGRSSAHATDTDADDDGANETDDDADDADEDEGAHADEGDDNDDASDAPSEKRLAAKDARDARSSARAGPASERRALIQDFLESLHAIRASWHENATAIREACHSDDSFDHANATKDERTARAHCIRDGFSEWRAERRADLKELRAELREIMGGFGKGKHASE
ncbi:MAG TPA: hypothetical protein VM370_02340 [Candidatus Thermoplasmatota archaeon]|nr:hypothetical protein [Candidatus Thermoplasmatota archaeon]